MKTIPALTASKGLRIDVDPVRTADGGWLTSCANVDIDDTGRVSRRKGYTRVLTGSWHSLFSGSEYMIGVSGDALCILKLSGTGFVSTPIRNVTPLARMSYAKVWNGRQEVIYYANGTEYGKIVNELSYPLSMGDYVGPVTSRNLEVMDGRLKHLGLWNGRLLASEQKVLWYSEPFNYEVVDKARNFWMFPSEIRGIMPLVGGVALGLDDRVVLLRGSNPAEMAYLELCSDGFVEGSAVKFDNGQIGVGQEAVQNPWLFGVSGGVAALSQDGRFYDLTYGVLDLPSSNYGAGGIVGAKRYVLTLEG